jgi:hypothetical protein
MRFGAEESRKILSVLIDARRVTASQASAALKRFNRTVAELKSRLAALESGTVSAGPRRGRARVRRRRRVAQRRGRVSAQRKKSMRDQGKYLAAVRFLRKPERVKIKKIRADHGLTAALKEAGRLAKAS